jgi:hypothetical protein
VIGGKHRLYLKLLDRLGEALTRGPRFSEIQWSTRYEFKPTITTHQNPAS